ncbi:MAG: UDP-4-amino-4,6-dideoxy-N-acetyl-beta-L-altrosamine transaminase [Alphaproteobacteria bacterium]|nr:UDP-4-amino-4,6-dideoxy-N-acetyl-beta-L-altrosamine transaminase [Alphaproteobacteria bacterium]
MTEIPFLPYGKHAVDQADIDAVVSVLRSDFLTTGPTIAAFEKSFAEATAAPFATACCNATAGLHLATLALGIGPGDCVIVPSVTFLATANAVRMAGGEVVFADVDPTTGLMGPDHLAAAAARATGPINAVFPVHLAGRLADMPALAAIATGRGWSIVEDACHALGGTYRGPDGSEGNVGACRHSDLSVFSFHPVKTIASGEGGIVTSKNTALRDRLALLRNHDMRRDGDFVNKELAYDAAGQPNPWYYEMRELGYNYRLSDIHAALGLSQLQKLETIADRRRALCALYDEALAPLAPKLRTIPAQPGIDPVLHLYVVHIDFNAIGIDRATFMHRLRAAGIGSQVLYIPVAWQPYYRDQYGDLDLPGAASYYGTSLALPFYNSLKDADVERVVDELTKLVQG